MRHVDEFPTDPLTIRCPPAGAAALALPEADGSVTRLMVDADGSAATFAIAVSVERCYHVALEGLPTVAAELFDGRSLPVGERAGGL